MWIVPVVTNKLRRLVAVNSLDLILPIPHVRALHSETLNEHLKNWISTTIPTPLYMLKHYINLESKRAYSNRPIQIPARDSLFVHSTVARQTSCRWQIVKLIKKKLRFGPEYNPMGLETEKTHLDQSTTTPLVEVESILTSENNGRHQMLIRRRMWNKFRAYKKNVWIHWTWDLSKSIKN